MSYEKLREIYEAGHSLTKIANDYEVSVTCIYNRLKKTGVVMRNSNPHRTPAERTILRDKIMQLHGAGLSLGQIAYQLKVSRSMVQKYIEKGNSRCDG